MNSLDSMYALLRPLRLYALGTNSLIDAELHAYGGAFALLEQELSNLSRAAHPQLAGGAALSMHEQSVGLPTRQRVDCDARRELILRRLALPFPPTPAGTEEALAACGMIDPQITERGGALFVSARAIAPGLNADSAWQLAQRMLPAHLPAFIAGKTWDELGLFARSWDELDSLGRSWTELALVGIE